MVNGWIIQAQASVNTKNKTISFFKLDPVDLNV